MNVRLAPLLATAIATAGVSVVVGDDAKVEFFESRIRPVLVEHCYKCHAQDAKNVRGGLLLDSKVGIAQGGESGPTVVPGKPAESLLVSALKHDSYEMPPDRKLPDDTVADFEKWIADGAVDPRVGGKTIERRTIDLEEGRKFWCFQPVSLPDVPANPNGWAQTPIDHFIAARHAEAKLSAVEDASPEQIVRRLYFALIGLPPDADQISSFLQDWKKNPAGAIDKTTDELLSQVQFGERWGRHWLDVTRFAESSGGGRSLMFPNAWRFRDYVIQSFNDDKPFDQLVREHIAGDLLPFETDQQYDEQVTGVGYLTLGPTNYEQQDKELLRMEVVDEQVDTIGRTFLGLTLGCARCHDHKFDPVPTSDYYAMAGIFRSTKTLTPGNVSGYVMTNLKAGEVEGDSKDWKKQQRTLQQKIKELRAKVRRPSGKPQKSIDPASLPGIVIDDTQAKFEGAWVESTILAPFVGASYRHDDFKKQGCRVEFSADLPEDGSFKVRLCHNYQDSRCSHLPVVIKHAGGSTTVVIDQRKSPIDGTFSELGTFPFTADQPAVVTINAEDSGPGVVIVDAIQFLPAATSVAKDEVEQARLAEQLASFEKRLAKLEKKKPKPPQAMSVRDEDKPGDWHIHVRGGIRNLGDIVKRGFVSVATAADARPMEIPNQQSGRLELAEWITSPNNPLTARVYVNRVWMHLIGEGIVRSPDNFGKMGRLPTHPRLLDYLVWKFVTEDNWSTKSLIRRIVASRIYRLSSQVTPELEVADPVNELLTRGFRRRLEAEALRDAVLQVSGQLNSEVRGGLTIQKLSTYDNGYDHQATDDNLRSVYVPFFRNSMLEMFVVFDVANANLVTGKRAVSTLPTQALYLLNSPYILKQSRLAAEHFLKTQSTDPAAADRMIDNAYLMTVGRKAAASEQRAIREYLTKDARDSSEASPDTLVDKWASVFQALFASMDFRYVD